MTSILAMTLAAVTAAAIADDTAATIADNAATTITANATLKDGSTVKGEFLTRQISGSTIFSEKLDLDPAITKSLAFTGAGGDAKVELSNGDKFAMTVANDSFTIKSLLGELAIPRASFRALALCQRRSPSGGAGDGLVFHCTFDDEAAITSPAVGPAGIFQNGEFQDGRNGRALYLPAYTSGAKFTIPEGMIGSAGTIEFWAKINEYGPFTDGGCPRFFEILAHEARGEISQDWSANNGSGGSGLTFRIDGLPVMATSQTIAYSSCIKPDCRRLATNPPKGWHHYALVWDARGIATHGECSAIVLIDGNKALSVPFDVEWKGPTRLSNGGTLFFPNREDEMPGYARRAYAIDEFKIWNYAKTDFDVQ